MQRRLVAVGVSLGGLEAIPVLLGSLAADFDTPVVIVQHRAADSESRLAELLSRRTHRPVEEPESGCVVTRGRIYLAPADYHILLDGEHLALSTESAVGYARPSIDVLFESVAEELGRGAVAVVLTGATADGAAGAARIAAAGGVVLVQEPSTAESRVAPTAAIERIARAEVLRLPAMGPRLAQLCPSAGDWPCGAGAG